MTQVHRSPLSEQDLDALQAIAAKANAHGQSGGYAPLYIGLDVGDRDHRDGWMFLCWPALNSSSAHCARLIFDYIGDVVKAEFGAFMVPTTPQGQPDDDDR